MQVWDVRTGECLDTLSEDLGIVWCLSFDETRLLAGSNNRVVVMWDYANETEFVA